MAMHDEARKRMATEDIDLIDQYTTGWNNAYAAGDTAGMNKYHQLAEGVRSKYNYSGGEDGSQYNVLKATQQSSGRSTVRTTPQSTGSFSYASAPQYVDGYQKLIDTAQEKVLNRKPFSYDAEKDPSYQQYRDSYTRQGNKAMQDTLAEISARTGGLASSYAGQAAQQTYDGYMSALADKIPELREIAYQKYLDEYNMDKDALNMLTGLSDREYGRYRDSRSDYDTDRSFAYGVFGDDRDYTYKLGRDAVSDSRYTDETNYQREQDAIANALAERQQAWREQTDQRDYDYKVQQDALDRTAAQRLSSGRGYTGGAPRDDKDPALVNTGDVAALVNNRVDESGNYVYIDGKGWMSWNDVERGLNTGSIIESNANGRIQLRASRGAVVDRTGQTFMPN